MRITALVAMIMLSLTAGCDLLSGGQKNPGREAEKELRYLQIPIVADAQSPAKVRVSIMSVIDASLLPGQGEDEELDPEVAAQAARRERIVIQALRDSLTENRLIELVTPEQTVRDTVREEILAAGHAGLSSASVMQLGESLEVEFLITGLIDVAGKEVNLVAQETAHGSHVYESTLYNWPILAESTDDAGAG